MAGLTAVAPLCGGFHKHNTKHLTVLYEVPPSGRRNNRMGRWGEGQGASECDGQTTAVGR